METLLPIRRRASQHPRRANRSPRGTRPSCTLTARPCAARQKAATTPLTNHKKNPQPRFNRNQQYSITAVSDGGGSVVERYAYSAYGQATIADASGSLISSSAIANRYTYTGREWDEGLNLYHYRARMYDAVGGRFVSRDPIGYVDGESLYGDYFGNQYTDPYGLSKHHWFPQSLQNELGKKCKEALQKLDVSATEFSNFFTSELGPWIGGELHVEVQNRDPRGTWNSHVKKILDDDSRTCCDAIQDIVASIPDWLKAAQDRLNMPSTGGMPELVPWRGPGQTGENFLRHLTDSICKPPPPSRPTPCPTLVPRWVPVYRPYPFGPVILNPDFPWPAWPDRIPPPPFYPIPTRPIIPWPSAAY